MGDVITLTATKLPFNQTCTGCGTVVTKGERIYIQEGHHRGFCPKCAPSVATDITLAKFKPYEQCV